MTTNPPTDTKTKAKALWDGMAKPSARKVAAALEEQGISVSYRTVARWYGDGWDGLAHAILKKVAALPKREADVVENGLSAAIAAPSDPEEVADIEAEMDALVGEIKDLPLSELHERTRMALNVVLMRRVAAKANLLALTPKATAAFVMSMTDATKPLTMISAAPATAPASGEMIDVTPQHNPLSDAIAQFKRRTGVAA